MNKKIGIRFLTQFIVMCIIRLFIAEGYYSEMNVTVTFVMLGYAFLFTLLLECFDHLVIHYVKYYKYIRFLLVMILVIIMLKTSIYYQLIFGYLLIVMLKDLYKLTSMQLSLEEFQQNYDKRDANQ